MSALLLLLNFIVPFVMILVGDILKKHPAADMKSNNGYNTPTSRKSQEHWDYAQRIAPGNFIPFGKALGIIEIVLSVGMFLLHIPLEVAISVGSCVGFGFLLLVFFKTEYAGVGIGSENHLCGLLCGDF